MVAPPGWSEPHQNPEFDEYILMVRCRKQIEIEGETVTLKVSESLLVRKGARVRLWCLPIESAALFLYVFVNLLKICPCLKQRRIYIAFITNPSNSNVFSFGHINFTGFAASGFLVTLVPALQVNVVHQ